LIVWASVLWERSWLREKPEEVERDRVLTNPATKEEGIAQIVHGLRGSRNRNPLASSSLAKTSRFGSHLRVRRNR